MDRLFSDFVEEEILQQGTVQVASTGANVRAKTWDELVGWQEAQETLRALGFQPGSGTAWSKLGFSIEACDPPSADKIERRGYIAEAVLSFRKSCERLECAGHRNG